MSNRIISQTELEESGTFESESDTEKDYGPTRHYDGEFQDVENQVIRYIMSRELKNQLIRRENITQFYSNRRINYDALMSRVKYKLQEVYGLTLVAVPLKEGDKKTKSRQNKGRQPLMLTNCLGQAAREVLLEIWVGDSETAVPNNRNSGDTHYFLPKYNKTSSLGSNIETVKSGVTLLIMSLIIISENHISEYELVNSVRQFGITDDINAKNSNFNASLPDFINELIKKEYIEKEVQRNSKNLDTNDYKLGRRSLIEFTPLSVFAFIKAIYADNFDTDTEKKALTTIEKAYGTSLDVPRIRTPELPNNQATVGQDQNNLVEQASVTMSEND